MPKHADLSRTHIVLGGGDGARCSGFPPKGGRAVLHHQELGVQRLRRKNKGDVKKQV